MRSFFKFIPLLLFVALPRPVQSISDKRDKVIVDQLLKGQEYLLRRHYDDALRIFASLKKEFPNSPAGYFGEMASFQIKMLETESFELEEAFKVVSKQGEKAVAFVLQRYQPSAQELRLAGSFYGLLGFAQARHERWISAYFLGTKSQQIFRRLKREYPNFHDADFGIGMYLYWKSVFADRLPFIPFISDRRKEGEALVQNAQNKGWMTRELAGINLGTIALEEKRYPEAVKIFSDFLTQYPHNLLLRSFLGRTSLAMQQYKKAEEEFRKTLVVDASYAKGIYFVAISLLFQEKPALLSEAEQHLRHFLELRATDEWKSFAHYWLGVIEEKRGDMGKAKDEYERALALNPKLKQATFRIRGLGGGL